MKNILIFTMLLLLSVLSWGEAQYTVVKGDTLFSIALRYEVTLSVLMEINGISDATSLRVGQVLKIPSTYEVTPGDTYYGIAVKHGITTAQLLALNHREESDILLVGEQIVVPSRLGSPADLSSGSGSVRMVEETSMDPKQDTPEEKNLFWPHQGAREPLSGKLKGESFSGKAGDPVISVSAGKVVWVAPYRGYNRLIIIEGPSRHLYAYGGNDAALVSVGDQVFPGMEIGVLGTNPHQGEAKAFFFVYKDGVPVDPSQAPR
jgi:LysM repeat protein